MNANDPVAKQTTAEEANSAGGYRTRPLDTTQMPTGISHIVGNEAAERFSFYGMKAILTVFMTQYLLNSSGAVDPMSEGDAKFWYHTFIVAGYTFPLVGAIVSDWLFGKYPTIMVLSVVYCLGHLALALDETRVGLFVGLTLIAVGMGAIKPCVTAHVGDQFGPRNKHLMSRVFGWFYLSINLGAFVSSLLTPILIDSQKFSRTFVGPLTNWLDSLGIHPGPSLAFGVPGVLMAIATLVFWLGRHQFVHIPPRGNAFLREAFSQDSLASLKRLAPIYVCVAAFWCLFDQTGSAWVLQAEKMDRNWLHYEWNASQLQAANPLFILILIPVFSYVIYPAINRVFELTLLRKIGLGMFLTVPVFVISALIQANIDQGGQPSVGWQVLAYAVLTAAEVMVSVSCYELSYAQAPNSLKSFIMSIYLLSIALGNEFTAVVNYFNQREDGTLILDGANYYWFFAGVMLVGAVAYVVVAMRFQGKTYIQGEDASA